MTTRYSIAYTDTLYNGGERVATSTGFAVKEGNKFKFRVVHGAAMRVRATSWWFDLREVLALVEQAKKQLDYYFPCYTVLGGRKEPGYVSDIRVEDQYGNRYTEEDLEGHTKPIKFFMSYNHGVGFGRCRWTAEEARDMVRADPSRKTLPVRPLTGDDFADYHQRIILGQLGYFSIDLPEHRARREEQEARKQEIAAAYRSLGINQKREYDRIAGSIPNSEGTWPRSTARYARDVESLDNSVLAHGGYWDKIRCALKTRIALPTNEELRRDFNRVNAGFRFGPKQHHPGLDGIDGFPDDAKEEARAKYDAETANGG